MRITCTTVFRVTLVVAWVCFASFGDFNLYVVYPDRKVLKDVATPFDRFLWGGLFALAFATVDTVALWIWQRLRGIQPRRPVESDVSERHNVA